MTLFRQVEGIGPLDAKIMIIGEALGADEVLKGEPFVGWSGQFLREMVERAGLSWNTLRVDNVVQYKPDRNDFSKFYLDKSQREPSDELQMWWDDLYRRVERVKPRVIVAAGDQPLYALIGHKGSTSWRGSVVETTIGGHRCFVIPIVHPSYSRRCFNMTSSKMKDMRQPWFHISVFDLIKAKKVADEGWTPKERNEKIFPTYHEVMDYLDELDAMPSDTSITIDIETLRREYVKCLGLTHRDDYAMCIPFVSNTSGQSYYTITQEAEIWKKLDKVLNSHLVNGQTVGFDCSYLDRDIGLWFTDNLYIDTAILHSLLYPELKHDLGFLASMYTDMSYFKYLGRGSEAKTNIAQTFSYNCQDVMSTHEIAMALREEAIEAGMWEYYISKRLPLAKWAVEQHKRGISIDESRRNEIIQKVYYEDIKPKHDIFNECLKEVGYPLGKLTKTYIDKFEGLELDYSIEDTFNVKSPQQVVHLLRSLGYNVKDSSEETLSLIANESIVAKTIMDLRSDYSLLSSISRPTDGDNKFRTSMNLHVTETTRLSSTKSHFGTGSNIQNVTRKARPLFCGDYDE